MRSDEALLLDMLIAARKIQGFTAGMSQSAFNANEMAQSAVIREFQVIGEAARLISSETKARHSEFEWHAIAGMRNRLIHEYFDIDLNLVWQTVQDNIADLVKQLERIVPADEDEKKK